jgi:hypothetical protein
VKALHILGAALGWLAIVTVTIWAAAALYFDLHPGAATAYVLVILLALIFLRAYWRRVGATLGGFAIVLAWWLTQRASNDRTWQPDVARTAAAEIAGDTVTVRDFRNCDYRTETDYTPRWETKTVHLSELRDADLAINYWGSPLIAHPIVSFRFGDDDHVAFSIETRKEVGESYSALRGFFRQYELIYVVGDERDLLRVRTNYRQGEDVYLYRLNLPPEEVRERFLEYIARLNELHTKPVWYNALTTNCTTSIRTQRAGTKRAPFDWRIIANGKMDESLYERGVLDRSLPFPELRQRARINELARAADDAPDFSRRIRANLSESSPSGNHR